MVTFKPNLAIDLERSSVALVHRMPNSDLTQVDVQFHYDLAGGWGTSESRLWVQVGKPPAGRRQTVARAILRDILELRPGKLDDTLSKFIQLLGETELDQVVDWLWGKTDALGK